MRYEVVWFKLGGYNIEGMVLKEHKNGWLTLKAFFTGHQYKVKRSETWQQSHPSQR